MKKVLAILLAVLSLCLVFAGCSGRDSGEDKKTYYTVIFRQVGEEDVSIKVESGAGLTEEQIPTPKQKDGYAIGWESFDLSCVTSNIIINAIEVQSGVKITLVYPEMFPQELIEVREITVSKGVSFVLPKKVAGPIGNAWGIKGWRTEDGVLFPFSGVYNLDEGVTLVAEVEQWI